MENQKNLPFNIATIAVLDYTLAVILFSSLIISLFELFTIGLRGLGFGRFLLSLLPSVVLITASWLSGDSLRKGLRRGKIIHIVLYSVISVCLIYFSFVMLFNPILYLVVIYSIASIVVLTRTSFEFENKK